MAKTTKKRTQKKVRKRSSGSLPGRVVGELNGFPVRHVQVGALTGATYNPREITDEALAGLKASLAEFGMPQPIVWNRRTQVIVGGHQRVSGLDPNSFTDVVEVDLDDNEEKALNLALNNPYMAGEFTTRLGSLLEEIKSELPDLSERLMLPQMEVDVPSFDVDDLIADDVSQAGKGEATGGIGETPNDRSEAWAQSNLRQIVMVLTNRQNERVTAQLKAVMKKENCESFSAAVMHLLRSYRKAS